MSPPVPVEEDDDVQRALTWFHTLAGPGLALRITAAQEHFRQMTRLHAGRVDWFGVPSWLMPSDPVAALLAQGQALISDRRCYDFRIGGAVIPFIKAVGLLLSHIKQVGGADDRARRMLAANQDHPEGALFELIAAGRYKAKVSGQVDFIPEVSTPTPDFSVDLGAIKLYIECKRLRASDFDAHERDAAARLFSGMTELLHRRKISVHMDVSFNVPIMQIPTIYLADHFDRAIAIDPRRVSYRWNDALGIGSGRPANVAAVRADSEVEGALMLGPKMVHLLTDARSPEYGYCFSLGGIPHDEDNRYIDTVDYASVLTWESNSPEAAAANAQHVRSILAKIDRQIKAFGLGIAHIAVDVPRSARAAELKKERNDETIRSFTWTAQMAELHVHYLQDRANELTSWAMDESSIYHAVNASTFLDDTRMFGGEDIGTQPGWRIPFPGPSD